MKGKYKDFLENLGKRESGGNYEIVNSLGYLGKYQFGEAMLKDLGYYYEDNNANYYKNDWKGKWTGKNGIWSKEDFLKNKEVQEIAIMEEMNYLDNIFKNININKYNGNKINDIEITKSGMLAGAHLQGAGGLKKFLEDNINGTDAYGTKISEYVEKFSDYETPFDKDYIEKENGPKNNHFVWRAENDKNTCSDCKEKDGKIFKYEEDEKPPLHPNCNCKIEEKRIDNSSKHNLSLKAFEDELLNFSTLVIEFLKSQSVE